MIPDTLRQHIEQCPYPSVSLWKSEALELLRAATRPQPVLPTLPTLPPLPEGFEALEHEVEGSVLSCTVRAKHLRALCEWARKVGGV